ncbi:hypothetical protein VB776_08685 [Arcicella sp. DC2W]|uniref:Uncharacterized protein n=1 Tax=Arcicella gelida TaxID=2984195 RepID=A0ABU5S3B2_9BACT|nr:hypothetical protein [Arcicella sp. DC2W]MEA5402988.1 hypothetical protein [Arcicella sp. DC2W]
MDATNKDDEGVIVIGVAYTKKKCTSGSVSSTFSEVAGYSYYTSEGNDYNSLSTRIQSELAEHYGISRTDVSIKSSRSPFAVIIQYDKEIAGWKCSVVKYAVGFGDDEDQAEANAVKMKNYDSSRSVYSKIKTIHKK